VGKGHSFFSFIKDYCFDERDGIAVNIAGHRLCSLMRKMNVNTAIIEEIEPGDPEISVECIAISSRYGKAIESKSYRIIFVTKSVESLKEVRKLRSRDFLAISTIINFNTPDKGWKSYIYSAIVTLPEIQCEIINYSIPESRWKDIFFYKPLLALLKRFNDRYSTIPLLNNYIHINKKFKCSIRLSEQEVHQFQIIGTYFCQQNAITSVCAHASLCASINTMAFREENDIFPEDINKIVSLDHVNSKIGPGRMGLTTDEIELVLKKYGYSTILRDFSLDPDYDYKDFVYRHIESKCPVFLVFSTRGGLHIVPVLGHTLNTDMWKPEAESLYLNGGSGILNYKSSSAWVDHFIIHDDNFGMYFCLPIDALKQGIPPISGLEVKCAIAVIPEGVTTPSWEAEKASAIVTQSYLKHMIDSGFRLDEWSHRIASSPRPVVHRTMLLSKDAYAISLDDADFMGNRFSETEKNVLLSDLPPFFWLSEISLPDLYLANRTKVIDFYYGTEYAPSTRDEEMNDRWLQIRFPHALLKQNIKASTAQERLLAFPMSIKSHYPLFEFERLAPSLDW
jgi:hypothetical protein